ncbi:MAG: 5-deoxy-glucuronate isomerase [Chloroflexi bacterium]|nr:5-deoxy-glucuronate isomerase [Chloroflexota bacterium]
MNLLHKAPTGLGHHAVVADGHPSLDRIRIAVLRLAPGEAYAGETGAWESALVLQAGAGTIAVESHGIAHRCARQNVFAGPSSTVFVAPEQTWEVRAEGSSALELIICSTPGKAGMNSQVITADQLKLRKVGKGNWYRTIYDIVDAPFPAHTMVLGETYNPPGFWSSAPPHKHEVDDPPHESEHEEAYLFRISPPRGFGMQRVYTDDGSLNESYTVEDGDVVAIPRGYHPVVAGPGYQLYYLWILAGNQRVLAPRDDPNHAWLKDSEAVITAVGGMGTPAG